MKRKERKPRCIAWVPRRSGTRDERRWGGHRCRYQAHGFERFGVLLCRLHAGVRERRKVAVDPRQIGMVWA